METKEIVDDSFDAYEKELLARITKELQANRSPCDSDDCGCEFLLTSENL